MLLSRSLVAPSTYLLVTYILPPIIICLVIHACWLVMSNACVWLKYYTLASLICVWPLPASYRCDSLGAFCFGCGSTFLIN